MKKFLSIILSLSIFFASSLTCNVIAADGSASVSDVNIESEYLIHDTNGYNTRYVIVATNNSARDIIASAFFTAIAEDGSPIKTVSDMGCAVKAGSTFILYGQFRTSEVQFAMDYRYSLVTETTNVCRQDAVNVEYSPSEDNSLIVSGTNYSEKDVQAINVRSIFFNDGEAIAFDTVNLADNGYTLHSGSSNTQELAMIPPMYDDYVVTWTCADTSIKY